MRWLAQYRNGVNHLKPKEPKALFKLSVKGIYSSKRVVVMILWNVKKELNPNSLDRFLVNWAIEIQDKQIQIEVLT